MGAARGSPIERFWRHVDRTGECWIWTGHINKGYGRFNDGERITEAHIFSYRHFIGPVPAGLELDHVCRVRACCNPTHLEPVTSRINSLRGEGHAALRAAVTHCPKGHEYTEENTYRRPDRPRTRECRICKAETATRSRLRIAS